MDALMGQIMKYLSIERIVVEGARKVTPMAEEAKQGERVSARLQVRYPPRTQKGSLKSQGSVPE